MSPSSEKEFLDEGRLMGILPGVPILCKSVEIRDVCTAARLPPAPFITGAKGANIL
eukprot:CAMPEP_0115675054 /NCGR_PEP_ID=MMETSP0272-20121206/53951_1 /TAXON_ID=71861 /ORGANISM="Scrippsiella trochoidea, Strain CCMP3099" /LENGTH=55 /DNA_ID=CAMNT_0003114007 /DNA_START=297 /DNA_END=464 /DNA_ORIENTATION=+